MDDGIKPAEAGTTIRDAAVELIVERAKTLAHLPDYEAIAVIVDEATVAAVRFCRAAGWDDDHAIAVIREHMRLNPADYDEVDGPEPGDDAEV